MPIVQWGESPLYGAVKHVGISSSDSIPLSTDLAQSLAIEPIPCWDCILKTYLNFRRLPKGLFTINYDFNSTWGMHGGPRSTKSSLPSLGHKLLAISSCRRYDKGASYLKFKRREEQVFLKVKKCFGDKRISGWEFIYSPCEYPHTYIKACTSKVNCLMVVFYKLSLFAYFCCCCC